MSIVVAIAVGALVFAAVQLVLRGHRRAVVRERLLPYAPLARRRRTPLERGELMARAERSVGGSNLGRRAALLIDRAGLDVGPGAAVLLDLALAFVAFVFMLDRGGIGSALLGALVAGAAPWALVAVLGARRSRAFENQLPEVLDTLSASLRAGHGFDAALQTVATDVAEPAAREFRRVVAEVHLGRSLDEALTDLGERIRSKDLKFVLEAISIQRQVGGSLAELFDLVAETVRSREQFRRKVKALTGMVRTSANVLTFLPIVAALLLSLVNHSYMHPLWSTNAGHIMLAVGLVMMTLGTISLRRIGTVKG